MVVGAAIVLFIVVPGVVELFAMISLSRSPEPKPEPFQFPIRSPEEIEKLTRDWVDTRMANEERRARDKKLIEEKEKIEEQRKQEVIQRRRERSAHTVAHDALDDFL